MEAALVSRGWPTWARYACATAIVLVAALFRLVMFEERVGYPFLLFYPAIIATGLFFNHGSGIFSCLVSAAISTIFLEPGLHFGVRSRDDLVALIVFVVTGLFIAALIESLHVSFVQLAKAHAETNKVATQRSVLLRELSHRVQNDLASMAYILSVEAKTEASPKVQVALDSAARRLRVLGRVHRRLQITEQHVTLDGKEYIEGLCNDLRASLLAGRPIDLVTAVEAHQLSISRAVPLGLIINELVTNAMKHAFPDAREGRISVTFSLKDGFFSLEVGDDGVGSSADMPAGHGLALLSILAAQLGGHIQHSAENGTLRIIRFAKTEND